MDLFFQTCHIILCLYLLILYTNSRSYELRAINPEVYVHAHFTKLLLACISDFIHSCITYTDAAHPYIPHLHVQQYKLIRTHVRIHT